jgi:nicotinate-nucleotide adenylyltransferase
VIIKNYPIYVYKRAGFEMDNKINARVHLLDAPLLQISATHLRKLVKDGKSIRYMVPDKVWEEIQKGRYYK